MIQHHKPRFDAAMLDIESMGIGPRAALLQVGVLAFNFQTFEVQNGTDAFLQDVDLASALMLGGKTDDATVRWWQDRGGFRPTGPTRDLRTVLVNLSRWFDANPNIKHVWVKGPSFDAAVMEGYYERAGLECPWKYNASRDLRTAVTLAEDTGLWSRSGVEPSHHALEDCMIQIEELKGAMTVMRQLMPRSAFEAPEVYSVPQAIPADGRTVTKT